MTPKAIQQILPRTSPHWVGDGFHVFPLFSHMAFTQKTSPFLMFDYAAPKDFPPNRKKLGVGQHPHRGFETVTIAFQGEVEHADSLGNTDVIKAGDVQVRTTPSLPGLARAPAD
jgi:quercetin 2,3-dioxygenase